jgi:NADH-quinone oxidoreductase subunit G
MWSALRAIFIVMAKIHIDGATYQADPGQNLLAVCLSLGIDLPYFCWHPAMGSVGSCRQCAVKHFEDENDHKGKIVMACMTPADDGTRISVADAEAEDLRRGVIEWLMTNHPHDCPVCEEGGECHLQDMTLMSGHLYRRDRFPKRTFRNQDLGPFLGHEMNRCITCYRCVRFYNDYAGGMDLHAQAIASHVYFGRLTDGPLESPFSGNLVEVCPTGVFTDKTFSHRYTRKWDLMTAPSVCVHCAVGCNTQPGARYGELRRIMNRYNDQVNSYFLCDRGRFGYGFVNGEARIRQVLRRVGTGFEPAGTAEALEELTNRVRAGRVLGIGSPRASLEANFLLRELVGPERFFAGIAAADQRLAALALSILRDGPVPAATRVRMEDADCVLVLGEDVTNTAPRVALSLRQATLNRTREAAAHAMVQPWKRTAVAQAAGGQRSPLFVLSPDVCALDDVAARTFRGDSQSIARVGFAIAHRLGERAPGVEGLSRGEVEIAEAIADALAGAARPLVVSGTGCGSTEVLQAAANLAWSLAVTEGDPALWLALPECNSMGLAMLEAPPLEAAFTALEQGEADTLVVLENDLYRRLGQATVDAALAGSEDLFLLDHLHHATAEKARWLLPAATFAETDATLVSAEGRAQRAYKVLPPGGEVREAWRWLGEIAAAAKGGGPEDTTFDAVTARLAAALPAFGAIAAAAVESHTDRRPSRIPRATPRYSGRTAMDAQQDVKEQPPPRDPDSPFVYSMEGGAEATPGGLAPWYWVPGWSSNEALNRFQQEIPGPLRGSRPGVRLIEPVQARPRFFAEPPPPFEVRPARWLVLPLHHCLGSEELSVRAEAIARRAPEPYLAVGRAAADQLGLAEGQPTELQIGGHAHVLPVHIHPALPAGTAGLPAGLPGLAGIALPDWGEIRPVAAPREG